MAHRIGGRKLSRKQGPRLALFKNLTVSVLRYERVKTTEAKAKEISGQVEKVITLAKRGDLSARRAVVAQFPNEPLVVNKLFDEIAPKYADRTSGYTRIVHIGQRRGDAAEIVQIELVYRKRTPRRAEALERVSPRALPRTGRIRRDGLRRVPGNPGKRTVQGVLEDALARLGNGVVRRVDGAGRTDAGVHALGQVIAFSYAGRLAATELGKALEAVLPRDVAIRDMRRAADGFNPRYAARYREYRYTVWNGPPSPLRERTALGVRDPLDTAAMARAGSAFIGRHDFGAFGAADRDPVRTVTAVRVGGSGRYVTIDVRAESFLRGQVRRMVGLLLEVGLGRRDTDAVRAALADPGPAIETAGRPRRRDCASGTWRSSEGGGRRRERTENASNDEREDHGGP